MPPPPLARFKDNGQIAKVRDSNLELYRIICMVLIVAHHFVVNSGVALADGPMSKAPHSFNTLFLLLFGAWGKVGINCFLMITGYYMCKSRITIRKFLKLFLEVFFYAVVIYIIFLVTGYETFSITRLLSLSPVWDLELNFTSCFIVFYLTIPFWTLLVQKMNKRLHQLLLILLLGVYTILGSFPGFHVIFNYVTWFGIVFLMASYIRLYPHPLFEKRSLWGWLTLVNIVFAMVSIVVLHYIMPSESSVTSCYTLVSDSNKLFAVTVAISSFLWFKNINMSRSRFINAIGASTFGVLLIHTSSNAMRKWLWQETVDVINAFSFPKPRFILYCILSVSVIFIIAVVIDQIRIKLLESPFFVWYDKHLDFKLNSLIKTDKYD